MTKSSSSKQMNRSPTKDQAWSMVLSCTSLKTFNLNTITNTFQQRKLRSSRVDFFYKIYILNVAIAKAAWKVGRECNVFVYDIIPNMIFPWWRRGVFCLLFSPGRKKVSLAKRLKCHKKNHHILCLKQTFSLQFFLTNFLLQTSWLTIYSGYIFPYTTTYCVLNNFSINCKYKTHEKKSTIIFFII